MGDLGPFIVTEIISNNIYIGKKFKKPFFFFSGKLYKSQILNYSYQLKACGLHWWLSLKDIQFHIIQYSPIQWHSN